MGPYIKFVLLFVMFLLIKQTAVFSMCPERTQPYTVEDAYKDYAVIFSGKVESIALDKKGRAEIIFSVIDQYKGKPAKEIRVYQLGCYYNLGKTGLCVVSDGAGGPHFEEYGEYLVFIYPDRSGDGTDGFGGCGTNFSDNLENAAETIKILNKLSRGEEI